MDLKAIRKDWKGENVSVAGIITSFYDIDKKRVNNFSLLIKKAVGDNLTTLDKFLAVIEPANVLAMETEMNNQIVLATTPEEVKALQVEFIHQATTAQHKEGTFKTSMLPSAYRSAVSVIGSAISLKISLVEAVIEEKKVVGYITRSKTALDKLIKLERERLAEVELKKVGGGVDDTPEATTTDEDGDTEIILEKDTPPITKLETLIHSMRHVLAELTDEKEIAMAKTMIETVWDLTPIKAAAQA